MRIRVKLRENSTKRAANVEAMIDSGAAGIFMNRTYAERNQLPLTKLENPLRIVNIDESENIAGLTTHSTRLFMKIDDHEEEVEFLLADIGQDNIILGIEWLRRHNPIIDWKKDTLDLSFCRHETRAELNRLRRSRRLRNLPPLPSYNEEDPKKTIMTDEDARQWMNITEDEYDLLAPNRIKIGGSSMSAILAQDAHKDDPQLEVEQLVPSKFHAFLDVFSEEKAKRIPPRRIYDHAIETTNESTIKNQRPICLNPIETKQLDAWIDENLEKGYITPSLSPIAAPVFFVGKKDGTGRLCVDYRDLNEHTKKWPYPIPHQTDLIETLRTATVFTKLDVRNGFHNIRIKDSPNQMATTPFWYSLIDVVNEHISSQLSRNVQQRCWPNYTLTMCLSMKESLVNIFPIEELNTHPNSCSISRRDLA
jgi:hypothetical protein